MVRYAIICQVICTFADTDISEVTNIKYISDSINIAFNLNKKIRQVAI